MLPFFSASELPVRLHALKSVKCVGQPHSGSISSVTEAKDAEKTTICSFVEYLIVVSDANTPTYGELYLALSHFDNDARP